MCLSRRLKVPFRLHSVNTRRPSPAYLHVSRDTSPVTVVADQRAADPTLSSPPHCSGAAAVCSCLSCDDGERQREAPRRSEIGDAPPPRRLSALLVL